MLDKATGRARITDFGLARSPRSGSDITREGSIAGTPAYMSPEQIATPEEIDHRSDIYSLGAVLYEMLTGERPFHGVTRMILLQVLNDEPRPPCRLNDHIPRDLDTITLKCLEKDPDRRYQTAAHLADDLKRWIQGEPVHARPISTIGRSWRWCKRNPAVATLSMLAAGLMLAITVGSITATVKINHQKHLEAQARIAAQHSARIASQQRDLAMDTINKLVFEVQDELDDNRAGTVRLKQRLLDIAVEGLERVSSDADSAGLVDATQINAFWRRGDTFMLMGRAEAAKKQYDQSLDIAQAAARLRPNDIDTLRDLEMAHDKLAEVSSLQGNASLELNHCLESLSAVNHIFKIAPNDPQVRLELILSYTQVAHVYLASGKMDQVRQYTQHAAKLIRPTDSKGPLDRQLLALSYDEVGQLLEILGDQEAAQKYFEQSRDLLDGAKLRGADDENDLADSYSLLGSMAISLDDPKAARRYLDQAVKEAGKLLAQHSDSLIAQKGLFDIYSEVGDTYLLDLGDPKSALPNYENALKIALPIAKADVLNIESQLMLAMLYGQLGDAQLTMDKNEQALAYYQQGLTIAQTIAAVDPTNVTLRQSLSTAWEQIVEVNRALNHFDQARHAAQQSIDIDKTLFKANPDQVEYALDLAIAYEQMSLVEELAGNVQAATQWFDLASGITERLYADDKLPPDERLNVLVTRMKMLANHGDVEGLLAIAKQLDESGDSDPDVMYNLACCHALAANMVSNADRDTQIALALTALKAAVKAGFNDVVFMQRDPDLSAIRDHQAYRHIINKLSHP